MAFNVRLSAQLLLGSSKVLLTCLTGNKQSVLVRGARACLKVFTRANTTRGAKKILHMMARFWR